MSKIIEIQGRIKSKIRKEILFEVNSDLGECQKKIIRIPKEMLIVVKSKQLGYQYFVPYWFASRNNIT